jgi:hypothetical protein
VKAGYTCDSVSAHESGLYACDSVSACESGLYACDHHHH